MHLLRLNVSRNMGLLATPSARALNAAGSCFNGLRDKPLALTQLYQLAPSDGDFWRAQACKCESKQWGMIANRL